MQHSWPSVKSFLNSALVFLLFIGKSNIAFPQSPVQTPTQRTPGAAGPKLDFSRNPALIDLRLKLEEVIARTYRERLSTQMNPALFQVSAQISLGPVPSTPMNGSLSPNSGAVGMGNNSLTLVDRPADINLGSLSGDPASLNIQQSLLNTNSGRNALTELLGASLMMEKAQINRLTVFIGFDESVKAGLTKKISEWAKKLVREEFKDRGTVEVATISKDHSILFYFSKYQVLIGMILLVFVLLVLVLIVRFTISRDILARNSNALKVQELKNQQAAERARAPVSPSEVPPNTSNTTKLPPSVAQDNSDMSVSLEMLRELQKKVGFFIDSNTIAPSSLLESWGNQGWSGRFKIAAVIDALLACESENSTKNAVSAFGRGATNLGGRSQEYVQWLSGRKDDSSREQFEAFQQFSEIPLMDRRQILEQSYWDILSIATMGQKVLKTRFGSLQTLSDAQIKTLLSEQDSSLRNLAVLHLPPEKMSVFVTSLGAEEKKAIFEECLNMDLVNLMDVENADERISALSKNATGVNTAESVSLRSLTLNLLPSLSASEEFTILPAALLKAPDGGLSIKRSYPSIAFIRDWPESAQRIFFDQLETIYIKAYLQVVPELLETVLKLLPPKTAMILKDEMQSGAKFSPLDLDKNLNYLRERLAVLVQEKRVILEEIFEEVINSAA